MRRKIVAGNWKMNKTYNQAIELITEIARNKIHNESVKVIFGVPYVYLRTCNELITNNNNFHIAAQNCYSKEVGAFTGEISAKMINSVGADYVIIGHSERRSFFNESDDFLKEKIDISLENELIPIFCCGELLEYREKNQHFDIVKSQLEKSIFHLNNENFSKIVIAYEPVWAIGTGKTASPEQAQEMHSFIRKIIKEKYNNEIADNCTILYGGSCNANNAEELFSKPDVDGGLIGGASLKAIDFIKIINSLK